MRPFNHRVFQSGRGIALVAVLVLGGAGFFCRKDVGTAYVKWRIAGATTPNEELAAYRLANEWAHGWAHTYSIEAADESGAEFRPDFTGDYDRVAFIRLTWMNGATSQRRLLNHDSLSYIYGE